MSSATDEGGRPLFEYTPITGQKDATALSTRRQKLEEDALSTLGIAPRAVSQAPDAVGSYALAETHKNVTVQTIEGILRQLVSGYQRYVINKAVSINYPAGERPTLTMTSQPIEDTRKAILTNLVTSIIAGSVSPLVLYGVIDTAKLLEVAGIPVSDDLASKLEEMKKGEKAKAIAPPAPPSIFSASLSDSPPIDSDWEAVAKEAIEKTRDLSRKIIDLPQTADAGRLLRRDTTAN